MDQKSYVIFPGDSFTLRTPDGCELFEFTSNVTGHYFIYKEDGKLSVTIKFECDENGEH